MAPKTIYVQHPRDDVVEISKDNDFEAYVWSPPNALLASLLASQHMDCAGVNNLARSSAAVDSLFSRYGKAEDPQLIRDQHRDVVNQPQSVCLAWPTSTERNSVSVHATGSGQGVYLTSESPNEWHAVFEYYVWTGPDRSNDPHWFLRILHPGLRLRINHTECLPDNNDLIGPLSGFTIFEYYKDDVPRAMFFFTDLESLEYTPVEGSLVHAKVVDNVRDDDHFYNPETAWTGSGGAGSTGSVAARATPGEVVRGRFVSGRVVLGGAVSAGEVQALSQ